MEDVSFGLAATRTSSTLDFRRDFKIWEYHVSHSQLLVRSPRGGSFKKNVDLILKGVDFIQCRPLLPALRLDVPTDSERRTFHSIATSRRPHSGIFVLLSRDVRNFIVATSMRVEESELGIFETSLDLPSADRI